MYKYVFFISTLVVLALPKLVNALTLLPEIPSVPDTIGQEFVIDVVFDTQENPVNVIEGEITFSDKELDLVRINKNDSLVTFWIEEPREVSNGVIRFAGMIPGSFYRKEKVASLVFSVALAGDPTIRTENTFAYLHDGVGTKVLVDDGAISFPIRVSDSKTSQGVDLVPDNIDTTPPEDFSPQLVYDDSLYAGQPTLIFYTQDKESGLSGYELDTGRGYQPATSPQVLPQTLDYIKIKAIDNAGNERIVEITTTHTQVQQFTVLKVLGGVSGILIALLGIYVWKRFRLHKK